MQEIAVRIQEMAERILFPQIQTVVITNIRTVNVREAAAAISVVTITTTMGREITNQFLPADMRIDLEIGQSVQVRIGWFGRSFSFVTTEAAQVFPQLEWKVFEEEGQLGDQAVRISQKATVSLGDMTESVFIMLKSGAVYLLWIEDIVQDARQSWLDAEYLLIDNSAFKLATLVEWIPM